MLKNFILFIFIVINISAEICQEGLNNCLRCNPLTNLCVKCQKNVFSPDENGGCSFSKKCIVGNNNCLECSDGNYICKTCEDGYFPDENGGCSYSDNCLLSERGKCLICKDDFILIGDEIQICKSLNLEEFKNCEKINITKGICQKCEEGYFLNEGDKKCSQTENCYESFFGVCKRCTRYYYLNKKENICALQKENYYNCKESLDGTQCDACNDNFYLSEDRKCSNTNYCLESTNYYCKTCIAGYYLIEQDKICTTEENCIKGREDLGICLECKNGFAIDYKDGKCKSNQEDTKYKYCALANGDCIKCLEGFYLSEDNKCSPSRNCSEVENGNCIECSDNYYLGADNKCTDVEHCMYSDENYKCIECKKDYYYNQEDNICSFGEGKLKNCKVSAYGIICQQCKDDFYINQTDYICRSNSVPDFYKCTRTNYDNICIECSVGYYLGHKYGKCSTINGCAKEEDIGKCIECDDNFCLSQKNGKCEPNDKVENEEKLFFFKCNKTNVEGIACETCLDGYTLNIQGLCIDEAHCIEKDKEGNCLKCEEEGRSIYCLNNKIGCIGSYYSNCIECNDILDYNNCTKCIDGYKIDSNGQCIEV